MSNKVTINFPTEALHPREDSGTKEIYYTDMRMAIAHAIREFNPVDIFNFPLLEQDQKLLRNLSTKPYTILADNIENEIWQEAIQDPTFQDKLTLYIYTNWWDTSINIKMVDRQAQYLNLFKLPVPQALKTKYKNIQNYCLYKDILNEDLLARRQAWFNYCDHLLDEDNPERLTLDDVEFYEKVIEYWEKDVKKQPQIREPLQTPYGVLQPKMVRRKYRDIRDTHIEWHTQYLIEHPDIDPESYEGRCEVILAWSEERARREVARLRKQLDIPEGGQ